MATADRTPAELADGHGDAPVAFCWWFPSRLLAPSSPSRWHRGASLSAGRRRAQQGLVHTAEGQVSGQLGSLQRSVKWLILKFLIVWLTTTGVWSAIFTAPGAIRSVFSFKALIWQAGNLASFLFLEFSFLASLGICLYWQLSFQQRSLAEIVLWMLW